jgi:predicted nuclease of predicted toxin-antitoxin system
MLRLLSDENLHGPLVRGLLLREPTLDLVRAQDVGLMQTDDRIILEWCATEGRILLSHDRRTVTHFAYDRVAAGLIMPGVFLINNYSLLDN